MMNLFIAAGELRKALAELEAAEANGFLHCQAVLEIASTEDGWSSLRFSDLWERAHPKNGRLDWGRGQAITRNHRFEDGKLVPIASRLVDRTGWPRGAWDGEPDRLEWRYRGLPCLIVRNDGPGNWCGYVAVPSDHPSLSHDLESVIAVHGGVTYGPSECSGRICHTAREGEADDVQWIGFDCAHCGDDTPGSRSRLGRMEPRASEIYRDVPYVRAEVERMADQILGLDSPPPSNE